MVKDTDTENTVLKYSGAAVWIFEVIVHRKTYDSVYFSLLTEIYSNYQRYVVETT